MDEKTAQAIERLADAIAEYLNWQRRELERQEELRINRMIHRRYSKFGDKPVETKREM